MPSACCRTRQWFSGLRPNQHFKILGLFGILHCEGVQSCRLEQALRFLTSTLRLTFLKFPWQLGCWARLFLTLQVYCEEFGLRTVAFLLPSWDPRFLRSLAWGFNFYHHFPAWVYGQSLTFKPVLALESTTSLYRQDSRALLTQVTRG